MIEPVLLLAATLKTMSYRLLDFHILPQPDNTTCGPTCLHAIYRYYKDPIALKQVIKEVDTLEEGGTLAVFLACHALKRGYDAALYTYNLQVFDPTWFHEGIDLRNRIKQQMKFKKHQKLRRASKAYLEFLDLGGEIKFEDLTPALIRKFLNQSTPIITGLSSTYLYRAMREHGADCKDDDVRGEPSGHFMVLCGYDRNEKNVFVADPFHSNPLSKDQLYPVKITRVIGSILLGVVTYDANLLIIQPKDKKVSGRLPKHA